MRIHAFVLAVSLCLLPKVLFALDPDMLDSKGNWHIDGEAILNSRERIPSSRATHVPDAGAETEAPALPKAGIQIPKEGPYPSLLSNNIIVAYYGHPRSSRLGILGEQSLEETAKLLQEKASTFDALNGDQGVIPAFHLIYGTVWADAEIGLLPNDLVKKYIEFAQSKGMIVILDHQLGKYSVEDAVKTMLPWLKYPNVHLAIDPEWKTLNPGKEIGSIRGEDINKAQELIQNYLVSLGEKKRRLFIVHQFNWRMIMDRQVVKDDFDLIDLIHNADGYGSPALKLDTYRFVAQAQNMPVKGFKLFLPKSWKDAGYDKPLLSPQEVLKLDPKPVYINYQ